MAYEQRDCPACGATFGTDTSRPGRRLVYCNATCRQAARRARLRDPEGWAKDRKAQEKRYRRREQQREYRLRKERQEEEEMWERLTAQTTAGIRAAGEQLFNDAKVQKLIALALSTQSWDEATLALKRARDRHQAITNGS